MVVSSTAVSFLVPVRQCDQSVKFPLAGKVVAKFCAKYLHTQILKNEAYSAGDLGASVQKAFFRLVHFVHILLFVLLCLCVSIYIDIFQRTAIRPLVVSHIFFFNLIAWKPNKRFSEFSELQIEYLAEYMVICCAAFMKMRKSRVPLRLILLSSKLTMVDE